MRFWSQAVLGEIAVSGIELLGLCRSDHLFGAAADNRGGRCRLVGTVVLPLAYLPAGRLVVG